MRYGIGIVILYGCFSLSCKPADKNITNHAAFRIGFQSDSFSTGPLRTSGFLFRLDEQSPTLFLTAHHCVAFKDDGSYYRWDEVQKHFRNGWIWSMAGPKRDFPLGKNLPIVSAATSKMDIAAFYVDQPEQPYLMPAEDNARVGDTVKLLSRFFNARDTTLGHTGVVIYATDSVMAYEVLGATSPGIMSGTSGAAILNRDNRVISNSFAAVMYPNDSIRAQIAMGFPLIDQLPVLPGKLYGIGLPVRVIVGSIREALAKD